MTASPSIVVFDVGNVLLDWDPRHLYRRIFDDEERMERFLAEVCTPAWNVEQDRGRPFAQAVAELAAEHPHLHAEIRAFDERWPETVASPIHDTVAILGGLREAGVPDYAITNFSHEKFAVARGLWPFLDQFRGVVVSGEERLLKPDPAIYRVLLDRYGLSAADCLFIDDSPDNVAGALSVGMHAVRFTGPRQLADDLTSFGLPVPESAA
jgi:2-haloacid dehalogenase